MSLSVTSAAPAVAVFALSYEGASTSNWPSSITSSFGVVLLGINMGILNGGIQVYVNCADTHTGTDTFFVSKNTNAFGEMMLFAVSIKSVPASSCYDATGYLKTLNVTTSVSTSGSVSSPNELVIGALSFYYSDVTFTASAGAGYTGVLSANGNGNSQHGAGVLETLNATTGLSGVQTATASENGMWSLQPESELAIVTFGPKVSGNVPRRHNSTWH